MGWDRAGYTRHCLPLTLHVQHPTVQYFWGYTNTNPWRDNAAVNTHGNTHNVCPPLHLSPGKTPTKINHCVTFYLITAPEHDPLSTKLLSCRHYFDTAIHTFYPLALTFLAVFSINAISWENQVQNSTDSTEFPPLFCFLVYCWGFFLIWITTA